MCYSGRLEQSAAQQKLQHFHFDEAVLLVQWLVCTEWCMGNSAVELVVEFHLGSVEERLAVGKAKRLEDLLVPGIRFVERHLIV